MIEFIEKYMLVLAIIIAIVFILSLRYENIVVGKRVLMDFNDKTKKKKYIFHQRINLLLYDVIVIAAYFFPEFRKSEYISICVLIVLLRGIYLNKKYLNRWKARK